MEHRSIPLGSDGRRFVLASVCGEVHKPDEKEEKWIKMVKGRPRLCPQGEKTSNLLASDNSTIGRSHFAVTMDHRVGKFWCVWERAVCGPRVWESRDKFRNGGHGRHLENVRGDVPMTTFSWDGNQQSALKAPKLVTKSGVPWFLGPTRTGVPLHCLGRRVVGLILVVASLVYIHAFVEHNNTRDHFSTQHTRAKDRDHVIVRVLDSHPKSVPPILTNTICWNLRKAYLLEADLTQVPTYHETFL